MGFFLLVVLIAFTSQQFYFVRRRRRLAVRSVSEMLASVEQLDNKGLEMIAECYLRPNKDQLKLEPEDMLLLMEGLEGLKQLKANVEVMLELALAAENWSEEEAPIIGEMLRRDAIQIRRSVTRFQLGILWNTQSVRAPFYLQVIASSYCMMRGQLLSFYENAHVAFMPQLAAAF